MSDAKLALTLTTPEVLLPILDIEEAIARRKNFAQYVSRLLVEDVDYGNVGQGKPALKKPGAEKLATFFGLTVKLELTTGIIDWIGDDHGGQPLFAFTYHALVSRQGVYLAEADGHCNSWESRYRWRWLSSDQLPPGFDTSLLYRRDSTVEEFVFAVNKKETGGQYGKSAEYWARFEEAQRSGHARQGMKQTADGRSFPSIIIPSTQYRVPNPDPFDAVNSCMKIAHKRTYVAGVMIATNASDYFTQDLDDDIVLPTAPPPAEESTAAPPPRRQPEPEPEAIAPELEEIYRRMAAGTTEQRLEEFAKMKRHLRELHGDEQGETLYSKVLAGFQIEHATQFRSLATARKAMAQLFQLVAQGAGG